MHRAGFKTRIAENRPRAAEDLLRHGPNLLQTQDDGVRHGDNHRRVDPKQSTCGRSSRTATHQCGLQHLNRVLPFVEGGDGVDVQIHAKSVAELIGDELRINTGLTRKTACVRRMI